MRSAKWLASLSATPKLRAVAFSVVRPIRAMKTGISGRVKATMIAEGQSAKRMAAHEERDGGGEAELGEVLGEVAVQRVEALGDDADERGRRGGGHGGVEAGRENVAAELGFHGGGRASRASVELSQASSPRPRNTAASASSAACHPGGRVCASKALGNPVRQHPGLNDEQDGGGEPDEHRRHHETPGRACPAEQPGMDGACHRPSLPQSRWALSSACLPLGLALGPTSHTAALFCTPLHPWLGLG